MANTPIDDLKILLLKGQEEFRMAYDNLVNEDYAKTIIRVNRVNNAISTALGKLSVLKEKQDLKNNNPVPP
jgi:hypothetical protein